MRAKAGITATKTRRSRRARRLHGRKRDTKFVTIVFIGSAQTLRTWAEYKVSRSEIKGFEADNGEHSVKICTLINFLTLGIDLPAERSIVVWKQKICVKDEDKDRRFEIEACGTNPGTPI